MGAGIGLYVFIAVIAALALAAIFCSPLTRAGKLLFATATAITAVAGVVAAIAS